MVWVIEYDTKIPALPIPFSRVPQDKSLSTKLSHVLKAPADHTGFFPPFLTMYAYHSIMRSSSFAQITHPQANNLPNLFKR